MNETSMKRHCDERAAAEFLDVSVATLRDWRFHKVGPVYVKYLNKTVRYPLDELDKFAQQSRVKVAA